MSANSKTKVVIFNIDSKAGSLAKTKPQAIMDIMLRAFNEAIGLCGTTPWVADMERELIKEGVYDTFKSLFNSYANKDWTKDGRNQAFLNRDNIIKALVDTRNMDVESARKYFDDQVNNFSMTTERFAKTVNDYCKKNKVRVAFLMDEVGQFVGTNTELMLNLQTCVEDLGRFCEGKVWVIVTSQQELKTMIDATKGTRLDFSKIQGRFDTRILLSGANADEVIKKRILDKKDEIIPALEVLYEKNEARLSNLIIFDAKPTWSGYGSKKDFVNVYPFVSYQFELLQKVFNAIREHGMTEGKHLSQNERSLLNAFQESSKSYANRELGVLVPFDDFYQTIDNFIDYDIKTVFTNAQQKTSLNDFDLRVLKILFMVKYVKEMPATIDRLATMMVSSINEDKITLKNNIEASLKALEGETLVQKNGDEYDFLTNEEQDVNKQIALTPPNEGEIIRTISQIFYEIVLQDQKIKYKNYEFPFNRFVDSYNIGQYNPNNITCKVVTGFDGKVDEWDLKMDSTRQEALVIDLQEGNFRNELIRASKISVFRQNHLTTMSPGLATILEKKQLELSQRRKRAEDFIKLAIKNAKLYCNGTVLDINSKDGKERVFEALRVMVESKYYSLSKMKQTYDTINSIINELDLDDSGLFADWPNQDSNKEVYEEIRLKLKNDKQISRISTAKSLIDYFSKAPYGWRELDIKACIGVMWKHGVVTLELHGKALSISNTSEKLEFVKGNKIDSIVVKLQEKIDDETLNEVRKIIRTAFNENFTLNEETIKTGVVELISKKIETLKDIQVKNEGKHYPGKTKIYELQRELSSIIKNDDTHYIFDQVINKKDYLKENAGTLDEILGFYQSGSAQLQNYLDATEIYDWYQQNNLLEDLSSVDSIMDEINNILLDDYPFGKMVTLGTLVYKAKQIKNQIHADKVAKVTTELERDLDTIRNEANEAIKKISEKGKIDKLKNVLDGLERKYNELLKAISVARNLDQYLTSSSANVKGFRELILDLLTKREPGKTIISIKLSSLIPTANKKITSTNDVEKVVDNIRSRLLGELKNADEINIE